MAKGESIELELLLDSKQFRAAVQKVVKDTKKVGDETEKAGAKGGKAVKGFSLKWAALTAAIVAASRAIIRFGKDAIKASAENEVAQRKFQTVFRGSIDVAKNFRKELTSGFAMSGTGATMLLSQVQDLLVPMGLARKEAAQLSGETVKLAGKIAAFNPNARDAEDVLQGMQSAMVGMFRPMMRFGVVMTAASVKAEAVKMGLIGVNDELTAQARAQAVMSIVTKSSTDAINGFSQQQKTLRFRMQKFKAQMDDVTNVIGDELVNALQPATEAMDKFMESGERINDVRKAVRITVASIRLLWDTVLLAAEGIDFALEEVIGFFGSMTQSIIFDAQRLSDGLKLLWEGNKEEARKSFDQIGTTWDLAMKDNDDRLDASNAALRKRWDDLVLRYEELQEKITEKIIVETEKRKDAEVESVEEWTEEALDRQLWADGRLKVMYQKRRDWIKAFNEENLQNTVGAFAKTIGAVGGIMGKSFQQQKSFAMAQAILDGISAELKALASPPGFPLNWPNVLATTAMVAGNIAKISSMSPPGFALGGIAGRNGPEMITVGERGPEAVLPANMTRMLLSRANETTNNSMTVGEGAVVVNVDGGDPVMVKEAVYDAVRDLSNDLGQENLFRG